MAKLVINPTSATKKEIPIVSRVISIGRDPSNDLVLSDSMVSRRHAILEQRDNQFILRDNNSSNGTMVNGDRVENEKPLRDGDLVAIGSSRLLFQVDDTAEASIPPAARRLLEESAKPSGEAAEVRCTHCGRTALATDRFCRGCGRELAKAQTRTVCPNCGTEATLPADFCGQCGAALATGPKAASVTRPVRRIHAPAGTPETTPPARARARTPPLPAASASSPASASLVGKTTDEAAGFGIRLVAFLVDEVILGIPLLLGGLVWMATAVSDASSGASGLATLWAFSGVGYSVVCALYYLFFWGSRGATPGKSLLGLVVRTESGETPIGYSRALLRLIGYVVSSVPLGLGFLAILFSEERLGLHDRIAGTRVTRSS